MGEGSFAKHGITSTAEHLSAFSAVEERYQGRKGLQPGRRLSCQAQLLGDIVIDVPADSQVHKQVVRKRAEVRAIELDTTTRLHYVEVEEPDMHRQRGDFERVEEALQAQWGLGRLTIDLEPLRSAAEGAAQGRVEGHRRGPQGPSGSSPAGPASTTRSTASRSTSARPPSPRICATWRPARCWPRRG